MSLTRAQPQHTATPSVPWRRWAPGLVGLGAIWGSSFLFIKVGVSELPPLYVALGRVLSGALVLLALLLVARGYLPRDPRIWAHNSLVAVVGIAAPFSLFAYGEQRIPSLLAGIWNSITPLVALPMAAFVFRTERMSRRRAVGLGLGLAGALVILGAWRGLAGGSLSGQLMCLAAAGCYGISIPYLRKFVAPLPYSGVSMSVSQLLVASLVLAIAAPLLNGAPPHPADLSWWVVASVVVLGAGGTGVAFVINLHNIRLVGATTASMVTYIIPIFATLVGVIVLGERLHWFQPVGAVVVLLGVAVSQGVLGRRLPRREWRRATSDPREGDGTALVKETELWARMRRHLGEGYFRVWASEQHLAELGGRTVQQAMEDGMPAKAVWRAVWSALELPDRER